MNLQKCAEIGRRLVVNEAKDSVRLVQQSFPYGILEYMQITEDFMIDQIYTKKFASAMKLFFAKRKKLEECGLDSERNELDEKLSEITIKLPYMNIN